MFLPLTPVRFLLHAAAEYGGKVGVVDGERRLTYAEVSERARRLAGALAKLGIGRGDRVATLSFNCHQLLEAYYGVPMAHAVLLSLNVRLSAEEQAYILDHSGTRIVMFDPELLPVATALREALPGIQWIALSPVADLPEWVHPKVYDELLAEAEPAEIDITSYDENSAAELFYTSGSTGAPKGVVLNHRTIYLHALYTELGRRRGPMAHAADEAVELHTIPLFHANGWGRPHTVTFGGGRHVMMRFEPRKVCELVEAERVTSFSMVPTMATAMVHFPDLGKYDLSSLEDVTMGGAPSSPALVKQVEQALGCRAHCGYGLTETSPVATHADMKSTLGEMTDEERIRRQAMTGRPHPMVEVSVVDAEGHEIPRDLAAVGEVLIRGDLVMDGYWREPDATAQAIENNWLHTGDMACWDEHNYVLIVDRKKDIIISGGENISSIEIEKVIAAHPAVYEAAVVGVPDEKWGEAPRAFVVLKPGQAATEDEIRGFVREHLANFKTPKAVEFLEELPKGSTGKILKRALREPFWQGMEKQVHGSGAT